MEQKQMGQLRETIAEGMWRDYNLYLESEDRQYTPSYSESTLLTLEILPRNPPAANCGYVDRETTRSMMVCLHVGGARSPSTL
jgi:hypothetical protein